MILVFFISLAKSQQLDQDGLIDIFTQYGDHLYSKGDHDGAIDQYIKTIGKLEASYVIRKVSVHMRSSSKFTFFRFGSMLVLKHVQLLFLLVLFKA